MSWCRLAKFLVVHDTRKPKWQTGYYDSDRRTHSASSTSTTQVRFAATVSEWGWQRVSIRNNVFCDLCLYGSEIRLYTVGYGHLSTERTCQVADIGFAEASWHGSATFAVMTSVESAPWVRFRLSLNSWTKECFLCRMGFGLPMVLLGYAANMQRQNYFSSKWSRDRLRFFRDFQLTVDIYRSQTDLEIL